MSIMKEGTTQNGTKYVIRHPERGDIESAWKYANRLSQERTFVSFQGEEITLEDEEKFITGRIEAIEKGTGTAMFLVADDAVQGICGIDLKPRSEKHVAILGLSVDVSMRGEGLGRLLMESALEDARQRVTGLKIVELTVKSPNDIARSLYKKLGFVEFGTLPQGTMHRGELVDEIYMYKNMTE